MRLKKSPLKQHDWLAALSAGCACVIWLLVISPQRRGHGVCEGCSLLHLHSYVLSTQQPLVHPHSAASRLTMLQAAYSPSQLQHTGCSQAVA